jgi:hypothetical protein
MPTLELSRRGASEEERILEDAGSRERFDRVAFAERAVDAVRPPRMTVAVCKGRKLKVDAGRLWGRGEGETWAIVSVPEAASREAIALAVSRLGVTAGLSSPYAFDVLLAQAGERTP